MKCENCIHYDVCEELWQMNGIPKVGASQCAFYKDKSLFVELPCKVGDTIYIKNREKNIIENFIVTSIQAVRLENNYTGFHIQYSDENGHREFGYQTHSCDFGKYSFFDRAEAEKALTERR